MDNTVLTDSAYESILELILSSEIKPGARIREDDLARRFGISRTPVREAVNRLIQNGFVISIKRKGIYCVELTKKDLLDLLDLRGTLEYLSFKKCIQYVTDEDIDALHKLISDFHYQYNYILHNSSSAKKDIARLHNTEDVKFHVQIASISGSERLVKYISEVENTLLLARQQIYKKEESAEIIKLSWEQHEQMLSAFRDKDEKAVREIFEKHLKLMRDTQVDYYE